MNKPLSGVRVVEMSTFVAGPATARLLSDMGAEVIKVEAPAGDAWRRSGVNMKPRRFEPRENPIFDLYNTGKQHIALNLKIPEGKEAMLKLLDEADVFVTNLRPASLGRLGLSYEDLKKRNPRLIYAIVLGYGEEGPDAKKPAFDTTAFWSRSGFLRDMAVKTGDGYYPVTAPYSVGDTATAYLLMGEVCAALYRREVTGEGDLVSSTLYHNGIFCMGTMVLISEEPYGRQFPYDRVDNGAIGGSYECAGGEWIFFATGDSQKTVPIFMEMLGMPKLLEDPRFIPENRHQNRYELYECFRKAFLQKTADEWVALANQHDLPLVRMAHFRDVPHDEQAWANGYLEHVTFPNGNTDAVPTSPIEMASVGKLKTVPAPPCGTHTTAILRSLGYTEEQIKAMLAAGAAAAAP